MSHRHLLNLKNQQGTLIGRFLDLPGGLSPHIHYLRQEDHSSLPRSYRSSMAFFVAVMVVFIFGVTAMNAKTMADSHRQFLDEQTIEEFSDLQKQLWPFQAEQKNDLPPDEPSTALMNPADRQARLVELALDLRRAKSSFQDFLSAWRSEGKHPLPDRLERMSASAEKSLHFWGNILNEADSFQMPVNLISDLRDFLESFIKASEPLQQMVGKDEPQRVLLVMKGAEPPAPDKTSVAGIEIFFENGEVLSWKPFLVVENSLYDAFTSGDERTLAEKISTLWGRVERSTVDTVIFFNPEMPLPSPNSPESWLQLTEIIKNPELFFRAWPEVKRLLSEEQIKVLAL